MYRRTAFIVAAILPALGLLDVLLYWLGGNAATISAVMLAIRVKYPLVAHSTAYAFGAFLGHVFFPSSAIVMPASHEMLARMVLGLSPIFAALIIILAGEGEAVSSNVLDPSNQLKFAALMLAALVAGGLMGRFVLCQHPLAGRA